MTATRVALAAGILILAAFVVIAAFALNAGIPVLAIFALFGLVACGNLIYGRRSRYAAVVARKRPAQEAHDRAADVAADARRAAAEAAKRGERFCPLDPARTADAPSPRQTHPA
ncbi:MAG TPA: hypothetical protein VGG09_02380 [Acidimicrobiales bacterium]|jgi:hypothetical protein